MRHPDGEQHDKVWHSKAASNRGSADNYGNGNPEFASFGRSTKADLMASNHSMFSCLPQRRAVRRQRSRTNVQGYATSI
jgi:hypothetical protein